MNHEHDYPQEPISEREYNIELFEQYYHNTFLQPAPFTADLAYNYQQGYITLPINYQRSNHFIRYLQNESLVPENGGDNEGTYINGRGSLAELVGVNFLSLFALMQGSKRGFFSNVIPSSPSIDRSKYVQRNDLMYKQKGADIIIADPYHAEKNGTSLTFYSPRFMIDITIGKKSTRSGINNDSPVLVLPLGDLNKRVGNEFIPFMEYLDRYVRNEIWDGQIPFFRGVDEEEMQEWLYMIQETMFKYMYSTWNHIKELSKTSYQYSIKDELTNKLFEAEDFFNQDPVEMTSLWKYLLESNQVRYR